ncbi:pentatricopeptide repeat-containing protein isoform X1 [Spatholobus suberectus]|nr:pentatricopeptide repeat-containing protein isoform X1 [Spatholobus suberectus]
MKRVLDACLATIASSPNTTDPKAILALSLCSSIHELQNLASLLGTTKGHALPDKCSSTWFATCHLAVEPLLHYIYQILSSPSSSDFVAALSALSLPLLEHLVLHVLRHDITRHDILPYLKLFD